MKSARQLFKLRDIAVRLKQWDAVTRLTEELRRLGYED